ncbi:MAG TPA: hypothetical protein VFA65_14925 [Bryobacteraceae bacterium]|nr:hypothetical protein [Bryobacteraceae bacterium]
MGTATLIFDQININNKRSDHAHSDNDWIVIVWFANAQWIKTDVFPLLKPDGDYVLNTGDVIAPIVSSVDCANDDLLSANFVVMNLGSTGAGQRAQAEEFATKMAQELTDAYLQVAGVVLKNDPEIPGGELWGDFIDLVRQPIVDGVGSAFDNIIIPGLEELLGDLRIGPPNCNGEVLHDIVLFDSMVYPVTRIPPPYSATSPAACGKSPSTSVIYTLNRQFDTQEFPRTPPPQTRIDPAYGQPGDVWLGTWTEDPTSVNPLVRIVIGSSLDRIRGVTSYSVLIQERVDPVRNVVYDIGRNNQQVEIRYVIPYGGNIFGSVRSWLALPVSPGHPILLQPTSANPVKGIGGTASQTPGQQQTAGPSNVFSVNWTRPPTGTPVAFNRSASIAAKGAGSGILTDEVDAISLPDVSIYLCLYEVHTVSNVSNPTSSAIGYAIRYLRAESLSYTQADVMLYKTMSIH